MAMKCLTLFLLVIEAGRISSCVFDKVKELTHVTRYKTLEVEKNRCFAECYNDKSCIALAISNKDSAVGSCRLYQSGKVSYEFLNSTSPYILHRDEVDLTCQTYLNI